MAALDVKGVTPALDVLQVSPNPFRNFIEVRLPDGSGAEVKAMLFDAMGRAVPIAPENAGTTLQIRLPDGLPAGMYLLQVVAARRTFMARLQRE